MENSQKDDLLSDQTISGETGIAVTISNKDRNPNSESEQNFNLNLELVSQGSPHSLLQTERSRKVDGNKKIGKSIIKGDSAVETMKSRGQDREGLSQHKHCGMSILQTVDTKVVQRGKFKSSDLSHNNHNSMRTAKEQHMEKITAGRTVESTVQGKRPQTDLKMDMTNTTASGVTRDFQEGSKDNSGTGISHETLSSQSLPLPLSLQGDMSSPSETALVKQSKPQSSNVTKEPHKQVSDDPKAHVSVKPASDLRQQSGEMALLRTMTPQLGSSSPKPSTQMKGKSARNTDASTFQENLYSKSLNVGLASKNGYKSSSNPVSESTGSADCLNTKSGSASKMSWGSKDSLESKTRSSSKACPRLKSATGYKDSVVSKMDIKARYGSKTNLASKKSLRSAVGSVDSRDNLKNRTPASKSDSSLRTSCKTSSDDTLVASRSENDNCKATNPGIKPTSGLKVTSDCSKSGFKSSSANQGPCSATGNFHL